MEPLIFYSFGSYPFGRSLGRGFVLIRDPLWIAVEVILIGRVFGALAFEM